MSAMPSGAVWNLGISDTGWNSAGTSYSWIGDANAGGIYYEASPANVHVMTFNAYRYAAVAGGNISPGAVVCFAVDVPNRIMWIRINNGNWNNSGTADPTANTGGYGFTTISASAIYPSVGFGGASGAAVKMNCGEEAFAYAPPSGFSAPSSDEGMDLIGVVTGTNTATLPTHQAGDLIVAHAFRNGSTTAPTIPGGQNWTTEENPAGANNCSTVLVSKVAASGSEGVGTFTNATSVSITVWRPRAGYSLSTGASNANSGTGTSVGYGALTLNSTAGKSNLAAFVGHVSTNTTLESMASAGQGGLGEAANVQDATDEAAVFATDLGQTGNFAGVTQSVGGTSAGWFAHVIEIKAGPAGYALTADAGAFTSTGQAAGLSKGSLVLAAADAFTLAGQAALLAKGRMLEAGAGTFALAGQQAGLGMGKAVGASSGAIALSGQAAGLLKRLLISAGLGAFALTGRDASLTVGVGGSRTLAAEPGGLELIGADVTFSGLLWTPVSPVAGAWSLVPGQDADWTPVAAIPGNWTPR